VSEKERKRRALQQRQELARNKVSADKVIIDPMKELLRIDGVWYVIEYAPLPPPHPSPSRRRNGGGEAETTNPTAYYDVVLRADVDCRDGYSVRARYAVKKRQLAREELRRYGLCNISR
jgi:hypothetical protein